MQIDNKYIVLLLANLIYATLYYYNVVTMETAALILLAYFVNQWIYKIYFDCEVFTLVSTCEEIIKGLLDIGVLDKGKCNKQTYISALSLFVEKLIRKFNIHNDERGIDLMMLIFVKCFKLAKIFATPEERKKMLEMLQKLDVLFNCANNNYKLYQHTKTIESLITDLQQNEEDDAVVGLIVDHICNERSKQSKSETTENSETDSNHSECSYHSDSTSTLHIKSNDNRDSVEDYKEPSESKEHHCDDLDVLSVL